MYIIKNLNGFFLPKRKDWISWFVTDLKIFIKTIALAAGNHKCSSGAQSTDSSKY